MMNALCIVRHALPVLAALLLAACDQPPTKEVAAAESALDAARKEGADRYASERFKEAESALQAARAKVQEKDYRGALSSATDAADKARSAVQQAGAARTVARSNAELARAEVQAALDDVAAIREEATKGKIPEKIFEDLEPAAEAVRQGLDGVAKALENGELLEAQKLATDLKAQAAPLPARYKEALELWRTTHPKGRRAPAKLKK